MNINTEYKNTTLLNTPLPRDVEAPPLVHRLNSVTNTNENMTSATEEKRPCSPVSIAMDLDGVHEKKMAHETKEDKLNIHMIYHGNISDNTILNIFNTANNNRSNNLILWLDDEAKKSCATLEQVLPNLKVNDSSELRDILSPQQDDSFVSIKDIYSKIDELPDGNEKGKCFSDLGRLIAVYKYGGLYLDVDVIVNKEFSKESLFADSDFKTHLSISGTNVETDFYDAFGLENAFDEDLGDVLKELASDYRKGFVAAKNCGDLVRIRELISLKLGNVLEENDIVNVNSGEEVDEDIIDVVRNINLSEEWDDGIIFTDINKSVRSPDESVINAYNNALNEKKRSNQSKDTQESQETFSKYSYSFTIHTEPPSEQAANQLFRENNRLLYHSARDMFDLLSLEPDEALGKLNKQNDQVDSVISRLIYNLKASDDGRKINEAFLHYMIDLVKKTSSPIGSAMLLRSPNKQGTRLEQILNSVFGSERKGYYHYILKDKALVPLLSELVNQIYDKSLGIYINGKNPVIDLVKKIQMAIGKFHSLPEPAVLNMSEIKEITKEICDKEENHAKELSLKKHRNNEIIKKQKEMFAEINSKLIQYNLTVPSGMESYVFPAHLFKVDSPEALKLTENGMIKLMAENGLYVVNPKREEREMSKELHRILKNDKASKIIADAIKKTTDASGDVDKQKVIKIATKELTEHILTDPFFDGKKNVLAACFNNLERLRSEEIIKPDEAVLIGENIKQQMGKPLEKKIAGQIQQEIQAQTERVVVKQIETEVRKQTEKEVRKQTEKEVRKQTEREVIKQVEKEVSKQTEEEVRKQAENVIASKAAEMAEKKMMEDLEKQFNDWQLFRDFEKIEERLEKISAFLKDIEIENRLNALKQPASSSSSTREKAKASTAGRVAEGLDNGRPFTRTIE